MANTKISALPSGAPAQAGDIFPIARNNSGTLTSNSLTLAAIQTFINNGIQPTLDNYLLKSGGTMTGSLILSRDGVLPYEAVNVQQVKAVEMGLTSRMPSRYITLSNLDATYNNGTNGVGATLTGNSNGALSIDNPAITPALNNRILVRAQTNAAQNGIYILTQIGSAGSPYILTRATDYDESADIFAGTYTQITQGSGAGNWYVLSTTGTIIVGTTPLVFYQFNMIIAGSGLKREGTVISIDNSVAAGSVGTASQVPQLGITAQGLINSFINVPILILASQVSDFTAAVKAVVNSFLFSVVDVTATTLTLSAANSNQYLRMKNGGAITLPVVDASITLGMRWVVINLNSTPVTFSPNTGNSIVGITTLAQNQYADIVFEQNTGGNIFRIMAPADLNQKGAASGVASLDSSSLVPLSQLPTAGSTDVYSNTATTRLINGTQLYNQSKIVLTVNEQWSSGQERFMCSIPYSTGGILAFYILYPGITRFGITAQISFADTSGGQYSFNIIRFEGDKNVFTSLGDFLSKFTFKIYKLSNGDAMFTLTCNSSLLTASIFYVHASLNAGKAFYSPATPYMGQLVSSLPSGIFGGASGPFTFTPDILISTANPSPLLSVLDAVFGQTPGSIIRRGASNWEALPAGTNGQYLSMAGGYPVWSDLTASNNGGAFYLTIPSPAASTSYSLLKLTGFTGILTRLTINIESGSQVILSIYKNGSAISGTSHQATTTTASFPITSGNSFIATDSLQIYITAVSGSPSNLNIAVAYQATA